jgi:6-phosphogluconolactonase/glucosamine-6-phosphate isomerase/deaminase
MIREARVFATDDLMTPAIAEETLRIAQEAVAKRGRCSICLSGGSTPKALNEILARDYAARMPRNQIHFFGVTSVTSRTTILTAIFAWPKKHCSRA